MKVYKTQKEVERDVVDGVLKVDDDVTFECDVFLPDVDINVYNIKAGDIDACNIDAWDIKAWNIQAGDINAREIEYYAFCIAYRNIHCKSIKGTRGNHAEPICLDGKLHITK